MSPSRMIFLLLLAALLASANQYAGFAQGDDRSQQQAPPAGTTVWLPVIIRSGTGSGPTVDQVQVVTPSVARYEKFEVQFNVQTAGSHPYLPYDPAPPPGVPAGIGVSVDAEFSPDNWATVIRQPGFFYQPYRVTTRNGRDHFTPDGPPRWAVRFAPQAAGAWQYRLRVQDAAGTTIYPANGALTFTVGPTSSSPYRQRGFLRVSPRDPRYFEFQDGTAFIGVGFNDDFSSIASTGEKMRLYEQNKMNFMRVWLSGAGINGSQWSSWAWHNQPNDAYLPAVNFETRHTFNGADVALRLDDQVRCFFADFWQEGIPVEPGVTYRVSARVKVNGVTGPAGAGAHGFVIKHGGWLDTGCDQAGQGTPITGPVAGTTDWTTINGEYTTGSNQYWLDNLYLARQNASGGEVYIDEVRLWRKDDPAQVNLLREPNANSHLYFDPMNSAEWDRHIELAEQHGVYLKLVIDEKQEWIRNHIDAGGAITQEGSNDNFYAAPGTKVRWLQQAWWRYLVARWGYSTAIHSFEYINEGDPYNGHHYDAANAMARYVDEHDPARHMVSTSFWHSFPNFEFWSNPSYAYVDYADLHAYISTGWGAYATFLNWDRIETRPDHIRSGSTSVYINGSDNDKSSITPRGLVIKEQGEWIIRYWMKARDLAADCPYDSTGSMVRVRWRIDNGSNSRTGVVPNNNEGKDFICASPAGTFGWTEFRSDRDRSGNEVPLQHRLVLTDNKPYQISLSIENSNGTGGEAWLDGIELVSPSGRVVPVIGVFDQTPMDEDTAWFNAAYGELLGGQSPVGAGKPLVRGETGVDFPDRQEWNPDLLKDTEGIWLHNNLWGQVNPGGMYELFWWVSETIPETYYQHYLAYRNFMADIPLSNGHYRDAQAVTSQPQLRAWGQRDDVNGRFHLWLQNTQHTWKRVVAGSPISPVSGTVTLAGVPAGTYQVTWWDTYRAANQIIKTEQVSTSGSSLQLTLPQPLTGDVAVKAQRLP